MVESMEVINLGLPSKLGSRIMLGTILLHNNKDCAQILNTAIEYGINTFDLAPTFMKNDKVKEWIQKIREKDPETFKKLIFVIKGGFPIETKPGHYESKLKGTPAEIAKNIEKDVRAALQFYNLEKADILMLHRDDEDYDFGKIIKREKTPVKTIYEALMNKNLKKFYDVYAVSNWEDSRVLELQKLNPITKLLNSSFFSIWERDAPSWNGEYQLLHRNLMNPDYLPNIINLIYSPLSGYFGAKICIDGFDAAKKNLYSSSQEIVEKSALEALFTDKNRIKYEKLKELLDKINNEKFTSYSIIQLVIAYSFAHLRVNGSFLGINSLEELEINMQGYLLSKILSQSDLEFLNPLLK